MTIFGNIFLCLAVLVFFVILGTVYGKPPTYSGDGAAGYPMGVILFNLAFLAFLSLAAIAIAWRGGFDWISPQKSTRYLLVVLGVVLPVVTAALSALFKYEAGSAPWVFRLFFSLAPALIPAVMLLSGFVMLNSGLRETVPVGWYKWPLAVVLGIGVLGFCAGVYAWMSEASRNATREIEGAMADEARYHEERLQEIDSCDVFNNMSHILVFTDANHRQDLRDRAIAKIKTNPQWQETLVGLLEGDGSIEAFEYLASNEVDDKKLFVQAIDTGIRTTAQWVQRSIRKGSHDAHFYREQFSREVERILRTVDKFEGMGHDYLPAVLAMRVALDEPSEHKKVVFGCLVPLDRWIKKHQQ